MGSIHLFRSLQLFHLTDLNDIDCIEADRSLSAFRKFTYREKFSCSGRNFPDPGEFSCSGRIFLISSDVFVPARLYPSEVTAPSVIDIVGASHGIGCMIKNIEVISATNELIFESKKVRP